MIGGGGSVAKKNYYGRRIPKPKYLYIISNKIYNLYIYILNVSE
jgi:hypothetical protein